jgi:6-phosphogluconolactonase (cycloisomerase 2 family)
MGCATLDPATGLTWSTSVACANNLNMIATANVGGSLYLYGADYTNGGIVVYQLNPAVSPPTLTLVTSYPGLSALFLAFKPDPVLYAQQNDAGIDQLYQYSVGNNGQLTALSPPVVSGLLDGPPVIDPSQSYLYLENNGAVGQCAIGAGGTVTALSPATVSVPGSQQGTLAVTSSAVYAGGSNTFPDGGTQGLIAQFSRQANGTLIPGSPATVDTTDVPIAIAAYQPDGGGTFVYVLENSPTFTTSLSQYTVTGGTLTPNTPTTVTGSTGCYSLTVDPADNLLFVPCVGDKTLWVYTIAADGTLTPTSWSPVMNASAPAQISILQSP